MKHLITLLLLLFYSSIYAQTTLNGTISTNTTWSLANSPYQVTADVTVLTGVTLTIEAGVEIDFPVYSSDVIIEGTLIAVGTSVSPIILNGPGGIDLSENSVNSQVAYVQYNGVGATSSGSTDNTFTAGISIGGGVTSFTNNTFTNCMTGLTIYNNASPTINQNTFNGSTLAGITVVEGSPIITGNALDNHSFYGVELRLGTPTLQNNDITNSGTALYLNGVLSSPVIENNTFSGNSRDIITHPELLDDDLYDGNGFTKIYVNARTINNSTTWHKVQSPETWEFEALGVITTTTGIILTIEPGFEINLTNYTHDIEVEGTLIANGTESNSIKINGPGGLDVSENSTNSQIAYLRYQGVGATSIGSTDRTFGAGLSIGGTNATVSNSSFLNTMIGLVVYNDAQPSITESSFDESSTAGIRSISGNPAISNSVFDNHSLYGVELQNGSPTLQNCSLTNSGTALYLNGVLSNPVIENNTFSVNSRDIITHPELLDDEFYDGNGFTKIFVNARTINNSTTWHKVMSPETWVFEGMGRIPTVAGVTLTMEPGFEITLNNYTHDIEVEGTLIANGTESDSIKINGPGGLDISENSTNSEVSFFRFQGVGATSGGSTDRTFGGGLSIGGTNAMVSNSSFLNSAIAVAVYNGSSPFISSCEIATAAFQGIRVVNGASSPTIENSCFSDISFDAVQNLGTGTIIATSNWWGDPSGPFNTAANPSGLGEEVSDGVTFDPWLTADPCLGVEIIIESQPSNQVTCEESNTSFSISASGTTNLQYQWQEDQGSGFVNLTDQGSVSGSNTDQLSISNIQQAMDGFQYRCVVSGDNADDVLSNIATLNVSSIPSPTTSGNSGCISETIEIMASGGSNGNYRWYEAATGGSPIAGQVNSIYTTPALNTTTSYYVSITNGICESNRTEVVASIISPPSITSQPTNQMVDEGATVNLSVTSSGDNLNYQWQKDLVNITGEITGTLTLNSVSPNDAGSYQCVITNDCHSITSTAAQLTVTKPLGMDDNHNLEVYPNPSSGLVYVSLPREHHSSLPIQVTEITGKVVLEESIQDTTSKTYTIDLSHQKKGLYVVKWASNETVYSVKVMIK